MIPIHSTAYLILAAGIAGAVSGWQVNQWRWESKYADQLEESRKVEQSLQEKINASAKLHNEQVQRIANERDIALDRLRKRPDRLPEGSRTNCEGSTGAELSRTDAEFLVRQASRADEQRQALKVCYEYADTVEQMNR